MPPKAKRQRTQSISTANLRTLVLDNGAHTIKAGVVDGQRPADPITDTHVFPNCIARSTRDKRTYVGSQLDDCLDFGELAFRRPVEKGFIVNWEGQKAIWESSIFDGRLQCDPTETNLILTEAPHAPVALQRNADEMAFEEFGFANYARILGSRLPAFTATPFFKRSDAHSVAECLLVIDVGHSHTTITPLLSGKVIQSACRRLDVGGKVLTNHLKDLVSSRQFELQKEFFLVEQMKEDACFVAESSYTFANDLERCWKGSPKNAKHLDQSVVVEYVLPDYEHIKRGFVRPHDPGMSTKRRLGIDGVIKEDFIVLGNERFTVPELLFHPGDIGMTSPGIAGTVLDSLNSLPIGLWQPLLANVLVLGATSKLPGLVARLETELRRTIDDRFVLRIELAKDPLRCIWEGGARVAESDVLMKKLSVSRAEYLEHGDAWSRRVFAGQIER